MRPMTADEAVEVVNAYLFIQADVTHKGDEVKCYVDGDKSYLGVVECQALADAFQVLAHALDAAQRQSADKGAR